MECIFCHKENIVTDFIYEDDTVMVFSSDMLEESP